MNLTKTQVELMDQAAVDKNLRLLAKKYRLDEPLSTYMTPDLMLELDLIINTLAYLEDRKQWLAQYGHLANTRSE